MLWGAFFEDRVGFNAKTQRGKEPKGVLFAFILIGLILASVSLEAKTDYFLPKSHPVHKKLDRLFANERPLLSLKSLQKAGFVKARPRKFTHLIVTRHPDIPGYIFKLYLDAQRFPKGKEECFFWKQRIDGAEKLRRLIAKKGWKNIFKVPHKWIYATPKKHLDPDYPIKYTLLVEEDMDLVPDGENKKLWRRLSSRKKLRALYSLLQTIGLRDCAKPDNIPFSRDGKIAFIDTQTHGEEKVAYKKLFPFLSPTLKAYWKTLHQ